MTSTELLDYCLSKKGAYLAYPFGDIPVCVKVGSRLFAQLYPNPDDFKITLNCEPLQGDFWRQTYPEKVVRGYHCPPVQAPHFNTVILDGTVPDEELRIMIDHAYSVVFGKLKKSEREQISQK